MLLLRNRLLPLLSAVSHATAAAPSQSLHLRNVLLLSTSSSPAPFSIDDYLVTACGLTPAQALKASKKISRAKSASNPDAVLALLSGAGLSRADISAVVAADPAFLHSRADNVGPRLAALRDRFGLSVPEIARFLLVGSFALRSCDIAHKLEFLIPFFGSFDNLLRVVKGNNGILTTDLEKVVKPNIALLQECGLSVSEIAQVAMRAVRMLTFNPEQVKECVLRTDKLGVPRSSYMFKHTVGAFASVSESKATARLEFLKRTLGCSMEKLCVVAGKCPQILGLPEETLARKFNFLKSTFGCSLEKLSVAICRHPQILGMTEQKLARKIHFLVTQVGLELGYLVERSVLLTYSLEKRLVPRHYVVKILKARGLMKRDADFLQVICCAEKDFGKKYIDCFKDALPGLPDAYAAIIAGEMPPQLQL